MPTNSGFSAAHAAARAAANGHVSGVPAKPVPAESTPVYEPASEGVQFLFAAGLFIGLVLAIFAIFTDKSDKE